MNVNMYDQVRYRGGASEPTGGKRDGHAYKPKTQFKIIVLTPVLTPLHCHRDNSFSTTQRTTYDLCSCWSMTIQSGSDEAEGDFKI